jgi:hypothetical protein
MSLLLVARRGSATPAPPTAPAPPLIVPLLVSVVIVPKLSIPVPPYLMPVPPMGPPPPLPPLIVPWLVSVVIVPAFDTPAPPAPPKPDLEPFPPFPPLIAPRFVSVVIVLSFDTPAPPAPPSVPPAPFPPLIVPSDWLVSLVIGQLRALTPSGPPEMLPLPVTVMAPPLLKIGPDIGVAMVWSDGTQAARATPAAVSAASAKAEAPASSAARETGP